MPRRLASSSNEYGNTRTSNIRVATAHGILKTRTGPEYAHSADSLGLSYTSVRGPRGANDVRLLSWEEIESCKGIWSNKRQPLSHDKKCTPAPTSCSATLSTT